MKPPKLDHVKWVRTPMSVFYGYFNSGRKKDGRTVYVPLGTWGSVGFFDRLASATAGRNRTPGEVYTVERLCEDYQDSREFAALSVGTRKAYAIYLRLAVSLMGEARVDDVTRADIQEMLDRASWGAGKRNLVVAVIGAAYKWGRARNKTEGWPTREIAQAETGERMPWPQDLIDAALECDNGRLRLAVALLLYTGQRIGDVCAMRWANLKGGSIKLTQQKTGKPLTIPLYSDLLAELDRYGKRGLTLLTNRMGGPISTGNIRDEIKAFCAAHGHPTLTPHGLRKNAVETLLRAECSVAQTAAITGQTYQLIEYYARNIDQERMAGAAILKLEQAGNRKRPGKTGPETRTKPSL